MALGIVIVLAVVCVALIAAVAWLGLRLSESNVQIQELFSRQHTMQEQLQNYSISQSTFNADVADKINSMGTELSDNQAKIAAAQDRIDGLENTNKANAISLVNIIFQEGDTLQAICDSQGVDYDQSVKQILAINGLADESEIVAGQAILIPVG